MSDTELTEKQYSKISTGRQLRAESDVLLPLLDQRREIAITKILNFYRAGDFEKIPSAAAELCAIDDMKIVIKNKIKSAEALERKVISG